MRKYGKAYQAIQGAVKLTIVAAGVLSGRAIHLEAACAETATPSAQKSGENQADTRKTLYVKPLTSAGGLVPVSPDAQPIEQRLAQGIQVGIEKAAEGRVHLSPSPVAGGLTLEGTISRVDDNAQGGSYILETSLFREEQPRLLLAHWLGTAENLRYLTDNLPFVKGAPIGGLIGELSRRVVAQAVRESPAPIALSDFLRWAETLPAAPVSLVRDATTTPISHTGEAVFTVPAGSSYQLAVPSAAEAVHLLRLTGADLSPLGSLAPNAKQQVLPAQPLIAGATTSKEQYLILLRRPSARPQSGGAGATTGGAGNVTSGPVRLQEEITPLAGSGGKYSVRPLAGGLADRIKVLAAQDGEGAWLARRVRVQAGAGVPKSPESPKSLAVPKPGTEAPVGTPIRNFWDVVNARADQSGQLRITMIPQLAAPRVGDDVNFRIDSQKAGALVVLEVGTSGRIRVWLPESLPPALPAKERPETSNASATAMLIQPGRPCILPMPEDGEEYRFRFDDTGRGRVRALVFDDTQDALRLLRTFPGWKKDGDFTAGEGISPQQQGAWIEQLKKLPYAAHPFLAADVWLDVQPGQSGQRAPKPAGTGLIEKAKGAIRP